MAKPGWYLDEVAHAGEEHLDAEYVATYDRKAAADPTNDLQLLQKLGLDQSSTIVDFGAGTGTFALAAAALCQRVVAVDVSSTMLKVVNEQARQAKLTNLEVVQAGFLSYEHQGDPADFVYSRNALHHLPDFWKAIALKGIADMLGPGSILRLHDLVYSFQPHEAAEVIEDWLEGGAESPELGWTRAELATHVRTEYSTFSWLLEPLLEQTGFKIQEATYRPARTYAAYTCIKR